MTDYVISYDICALMFMCVFVSYYYSCKRLESSSNRMFGNLILLVLGSIAFDLLGVTTLTYRHSVPVGINYAVNIIYFLITALMSVLYCVYALSQTRSYLSRKKTKFYLLMFIPYDIASLVLLSTPWTRLVFYFDSNGDYQHGPLMNAMLVVVVAYLAVSIIMMTFFNDNVSFAKRAPYYIFCLLMFASIVIQSLLSKYLMYGIAEALGIFILYVTNHNPNDLIDTKTVLFNRKAFMIAFDEKNIRKESKKTVIAFKIDCASEVDRTNYSVYRDIIIEQVAKFLDQQFDSRSLYYIDNSIFAILIDCDSNLEDNVIMTLRLKFEEVWKLKAAQFKLRTGMTVIEYPKDADSSSEIINLIAIGVEYSLLADGKLMSAASITDERESRIKALENQSKLLEEKYNLADREMQKAVQADRSKSLFLAQMSHEIRTPMTAILGMTELLLRDTNDPKVIEHSKAIMNSGKSLIQIINDILDFSKIEAGKFEIVSDDYYIQSTVYDIINSVEQRISDKRLDFYVHFNPNIPAALYGDEIRVKQIITNLMTNACKYTEKGSIQLDFEIDSITDENVVLRVSVSDTGIGIKPENIDKLFDGFERFDAQKNKAIEGTGLGLAITKQLVECMGGTVKVESTYGVGSKFTVYIPQKIVDKRNAISIDKADEQRFLVFCGTEAEKKEYITTLADFNIKADYAMSYSEVDRYMDEFGPEYTRIFVTYGEFDRRVQNNDPLSHDSRLVIGIYYRQYMIDLKGHNVIHLPVSSVNLAALMNGEMVSENLVGATEIEKYTAPEVKILVVDDNLVNLRIFVGLLECHKMNIDCADSGDKAIFMAKSKKYDLIFLDHMMPKKDGIETLHEMRNDSETSNADTTVIAFTANAVMGMKEMFIEQGFTDFLSKPIDINRMEDMIRTHIPADKIIPAIEEPDEAEDITQSSDSVNENDHVSKADRIVAGDGSFTVEGINMEQALYYTGGSYSTLKTILETFTEDGHNKLPLLQKYIENKDYDNYRIEIHAVKSLCKSIGANELSEKALKLETACKNNDFDYVCANSAEAYEDYVDLIDRIDKCLRGIAEKSDIVKNSGNADSSKAKSCLMELGEQLNCIRLLIAEFESDLAIKLTDDLVGRDFPKEVHDKLVELQKKLSVFDYDGATEIITEVLNEN